MTRPRGRPSRVPGEASTHRVEFGLTDAEHAELRRFTDEEGRSIADLARIALMDYINGDDEPLIQLPLTRPR